MLAASDFSSTVVILAVVLAAGAILGFWYCRKQK